MDVVTGGGQWVLDLLDFLIMKYATSLVSVPFDILILLSVQFLYMFFLYDINYMPMLLDIVLLSLTFISSQNASAVLLGRHTNRPPTVWLHYSKVSHILYNYNCAI